MSRNSRQWRRCRLQFSADSASWQFNSALPEFGSLVVVDLSLGFKPELDIAPDRTTSLFPKLVGAGSNAPTVPHSRELLTQFLGQSSEALYGAFVLDDAGYATHKFKLMLDLCPFVHDHCANTTKDESSSVGLVCSLGPVNLFARPFF